MIDNHHQEYIILYNIDNEIKAELNDSVGIEKGFKKYGTLDTEWFEKYKTFLSNYYESGKKGNIKYNINSVIPKIEDKDYSYIGQNNTFGFPCNFSFVTQQFMSLLSNNFKKDNDKNRINNELYKIAIGGNCIIMKDHHDEIKDFIYIVIYDLKKGNINNNIDYILNITDNKEYDKACDYILKNNIWNYLKKINFLIEDEYKEIFNKNNKKIGFIVRNGTLNRIKELKKLEFENIMIQKKNVGLLQQPKTNYQINNKFNSVLLCLYHIKYFINELINYCSNNINKKYIISLFPYFINFVKGIIFNKNNQSIISGLIETENYNKIIIDIFEKINSELSNEQNENEFDQDDPQFDEKKIIENFLNYHNNKSSIIEKLFYILEESAIYCRECKLTNYQINYCKILSIKSDNELFKKLFMEEKISKVEKCNSCGKKLHCDIKKKIIQYPSILTVVIEEEQILKFNLINNLFIRNNNISYILNSFIEANTNIVYYNNGNIWYKYIDNNKIEQCINIQNIKPIVLFYWSTNIYNNQNNQNIVLNNNNMMNNNMVNNNMVNNNMVNNNMLNNNMLNNNLMNNNLMNNNMMNNNLMNNNMMNNNLINNNNMNNIINMNNNMNNYMINNFNNMNNLNNNIKINMNNNNMNNNNMNNNISNNMNNYNMNNNTNYNNMNNNINNIMNNYNMNNYNMNNNTNYNNMNNNINNNNMNNNNMNNNNMANDTNNNNMNNNNINNNNMNNIMNNNNMNNNINNNNMNNNYKDNIVNNSLNNINDNLSQNNIQENPITIIFSFKKYKKQIYLDVNKNDSFENVLRQLEEKYNWLDQLKDKKYFFEGKYITNKNLTVDRLGLKDNSDITIEI